MSLKKCHRSFKNSCITSAIAKRTESKHRKKYATAISHRDHSHEIHTRELLEIKEQVLYDSRVRQQIENLRTFIDLKMNREEVLSELNEKADKHEMKAMLKTLSESMNASLKKSIQSKILNQSASSNGINAPGMNASQLPRFVPHQSKPLDRSLTYTI